MDGDVNKGSEVNFRKLAIIIVLVCISSQVATAQESKCELKLAQLKHDFYGLRIGMTIDQVKAAVPTIKPGTVDDLGFATTSFSPDFNPQIDKSVYAGVRTISLEFLDGRLYSLWIGFNSSYKWNSLGEFVPGMSTMLGLPTGAWSGTLKSSIECSDFDIVASMIAGGPSIRITDRTAKELWEQRRADREEKRSQEDPTDP